MKTGIYEEDGWIAEVEIVEDKSDDESYRYTLKVLKTIRPPASFLKTPKDGVVFYVDQLKNAGTWGGMWKLKEVKDGEVVR